MRSLETLEQKNWWICWCIFCAYFDTIKWDPSTKVAFEREIGKNNDGFKLIDLIEFLKNYASYLEASKTFKSSILKVL